MASPSPEARVVRKAGEGYDKPNAEQELPIDINYQKLSEWLVGAHLAKHLALALAVAAVALQHMQAAAAFAQEATLHSAVVITASPFMPAPAAGCASEAATRLAQAFAGDPGQGV
jgi:hypothetical protein